MKVIVAIEIHPDEGERKEMSFQVPCPPMDAAQTKCLCDSLAAMGQSVMMQTMDVVAKATATPHAVAPKAAAASVQPPETESPTAQPSCRAATLERFRSRSLEIVKTHESCEKMLRLIQMAVGASTGAREEVAAIVTGIRELDRRSEAHNALTDAFAKDFAGYAKDAEMRDIADDIDRRSIEKTHPDTFWTLAARYNGDIKAAHSAWKRGRRQ